MDNEHDVIVDDEEQKETFTRQFVMQEVERNEKGVLKINELIRKTALHVQDNELDDANFIKGGQFVEGRGKDADMVPAKWLPEPIKPFCLNPAEVPVPPTIGTVKIFRPMDMDLIREHDPAGQALIIFVSKVPQAWGPPTEKPYMIGLEPIKGQTQTAGGQTIDRKISDMIRDCQ